MLLCNVDGTNKTLTEILSNNNYIMQNPGHRKLGLG